MKKILITGMAALALAGCAAKPETDVENKPTDEPIVETTTNPAETTETEDVTDAVELTELGEFMTSLQSKEDLMIPMSGNLTKEEFCVSYGVDEALVEDVFASKAMISAQMADLIAVKVAEGATTADVLEAIETYYDAQKLYPEHMEYIANKVVIEKDGYLFVIAAQNSEEIGQFIEENFFNTK